MDITRLAIEKNRVTLVLLAIVLMSGYMAYRGMSRSQDPGFIIRTAMVTTYLPGASPERVEQLVSDKLEKAIQEMPELDNVISESKTGVSIIYVNVKESYKEMRPIWDSLRRKVERESRNLPPDAIGPYVDDEFGDVFGIVVTLVGDGFSFAELKDIADQARDEFLLAPSAAKVNIVGDQEERVFLEYNNARLAQLGLSPSQLQQILASQNIIIPGGSVRTGEERIFLEPSGNFTTVEEIADAAISLPGRSEIFYLKDIVDVYRGAIDPPSSMMYASGQPALGLAISMREGGNIIELGEEVNQVLRRLQSAYPWGVQFDIAAFEPEAVAKVVNDFTGNLLQSIFVVMLSMIVFLGLRTGLVVATLIPSTILTTFLVMSFFDVGLDQISLAALIISLGLLVDNAIVMSESCMVQMAEGKPPIQAAVDSANELKVPLLTSSLTTAAAFLPIFLAESATGEYTASLFKVVSIALLCSWAIALTVIPLLCAAFLKVKKKTGDAYNNRFYRFYRGSLLGFLRFPALSLAGVLVVFFLALQGFRYVPQSFFPDSDQPMFTAEVKLASGAAIEQTAYVARQIDQFIAGELIAGPDRPGVTNWTTYVGEGAPRFYLSYSPDPPTPELAFFLFNVDDYRAMPELVRKLRRFCEENFPDVQITGQALPKGPIVKSPIEIRVSGRESDKLFALVDQIRAKLERVPGTLNIEDNWGFRTKKIMVDVDQARTRRAGLSSQDVAVSLQSLLSGIEISQYREDDKTIPIVLRSVAGDRQDIGKLEQLNVYSQATGRSVPLQQIADVRLVWEPPKILRRDRLRTVTVSSKLEPGVTAAEVEAQFVGWLEEQSRSWEPGYRYELGGENESSGDSQASIMEKLPIAGMIIVLLMVGQFNSVRRPMIILATLPLGLIGVVIGLVITQASMGFMAFLGIISLSGIVINNAIVLLDRIRIEIEQNGHTPARAIIESAQRRLRPILLTTITTLTGLIPLWIGGGPMFQPMAITIIFGLAFATVLTLGVAPLLYSIFFRVKLKGFKYEASTKPQA